MDAATAVRLLRAATIATAVTAPLAWLDGTLFSWHPALMTVGALGAATEAALAARRARSLESGPDRAATLWAHARWAALALTCLALGMVAIVANKLRAGKHHLRSVHARVGAAGGVVGLAAAVLGSLAFRSLGLGGRLPVEWQARAKRWHRVAGPLAWSLCALSIELGLTHKAVYRPWLTRVWQAAVAGAAVLAGVLFYGPLQPVGVAGGLPVAMVEVEGGGGEAFPGRGKAAPTPIPPVEGRGDGSSSSSSSSVGANASATPRALPPPSPKPLPPSRAHRLARTVQEHADRAASHAAAACQADLAHAVADADLARRVNDTLATHCGALATDLAGWRDLGASAATKQAALAARAEAVVSGLAARMARLEAVVAELDARSWALLVEGEEDGEGRGGGGRPAALAAAAAAGAVSEATAAVGRAARRAMLGWPGR